MSLKYKIGDVVCARANKKDFATHCVEHASSKDPIYQFRIVGCKEGESNGYDYFATPTCKSDDFGYLLTIEKLHTFTDWGLTATNCGQKITGLFESKIMDLIEVLNSNPVEEFGANCKRCNLYNPDVVATQSYLCYNCRS